MLRQQLLKMNGAPECARMLGAINACIENLQRETGNAAQLDDIAGALLMKLADALSALPGAGAQDGMAAIVAAVAKDWRCCLRSRLQRGRAPFSHKSLSQAGTDAVQPCHNRSAL